MIPRFLFCVFTAGLSSNFVACATPLGSEIKDSSSVLGLPQSEACKKSKESFLPSAFKGTLKAINLRLEKIFGNKKLAAVFLSSLFSGLATYFAFKLLFKGGPVSETLGEDSELNKNSEDIVADDKTYTDYVSDTTVTDTNISASDDGGLSVKDPQDVNDSGDHVAKESLKKGDPYGIGLIFITLVLVCCILYCYSVSKRRSLQESIEIDEEEALNKDVKKAAYYGTREKPFYLFDSENRETEDQDLIHGENGNLDIKHLFESKNRYINNMALEYVIDQVYKDKDHQKDLARLENLYFKISIKNLINILDYDKKTEEEIVKALIPFKDQDGYVNFYISNVQFKNNKTNLGIVLFKDEVKNGQGLYRKVLSNKDGKVKLRTVPFYGGYALGQILKFIDKSGNKNGKINNVENDDNDIPMMDEYVEAEGINFC